MSDKWTKVGGGGAFIKWTTPGQAIEGRWRGEHDGKFGALGDVDTATGRVTFPINVALHRDLEDVEEGTTVKIVFLGMRPTKDKTKTFKAFDVFVAADDHATENAPKPGDGDSSIPF